MSMNPEMKMLNDIAIKVGRMEAVQESQSKDLNRLTNNIDRLIDKLGESDTLAKKALQSADGAHHRLNTHFKVLFWTGTTLIVTMIGIIAQLVKGG